MLDRIAQMHSHWKRLDELKSKRGEVPPQAETQGLDKVPPPPFKNMSPIPLVDLKTNSTSINYEAQIGGKPSKAPPATSNLPSTPPKLTSDRSSSYDLPVLPEDHVEDDSSGSGSSSSNSPSADEKTADDHGGHVRRLRKKVSKNFKKIAANLSEGIQKISPISEKSSSKNVIDTAPPCPITTSNIPASLSILDRNKAAKAVRKIIQDSSNASVSEADKKIRIYAKLREIFQDSGIELDEETLNNLRDDAMARSRNEIIDKEIDFDKEPHKSNAIIGAKKFLNSWMNDSTSLPKELEVMSVGDKDKILKLFKPTFLADFYRDGAIHQIRGKDGSLQRVTSPLEIADFISRSKKSPNFCLKVSNYLSQNLMIYLQQVTCGGLPGTVSPIRLHDGSPIIPRGRSEYEFTYDISASGELVVSVELRLYANNGQNPRRASQIQDDEGKRPSVFIDQDAKLSIKTSMEFSGNDTELETTMQTVKLHAEGWNYSEDF